MFLVNCCSPRHGRTSNLYIVHPPPNIGAVRVELLTELQATFCSCYLKTYVISIAVEYQRIKHRLDYKGDGTELVVS